MIRFYLSDDDVFDPSDTYLDNEYIYNSAMPTASSYQHGVGVELDDNIVPGDKFLIVHTNVGSQLFESDKSNNWRAVPINIAAPEVDLQVVDMQAPSTVILNEPFEVVWTVTNFGTETTTARNWSDRLYLTEDGTVPEFSNSFYSRSLYDELPLGAGQSYSYQQTMTIYDAAPGNTFLTVKNGPSRQAAGARFEQQCAEPRPRGTVT